MSAKVSVESVPEPDGSSEVAEDSDGYLVPVDPMEDLQCDSCQ
jgi:hypothetical protein